MRRLLFTALLAVGTLVVPAFGGAVITYGNTSLGVNDEGHLNFFDPITGFPFGVFRAGVGDAISPGCLCEGWGLMVTGPAGMTSGFVNQASGNGGLTGGTFGASPVTATSVIGLAAYPDVSIRHAYGPSLAADIFQVNVTITNNSTFATYSDLVYRRAMDWDVPPTEFNEFVTHRGVEQNLTTNGGKLLYASNNGFASSDPSAPAGEVGAPQGTTINVDFFQYGVADHGSVFDFALGNLAPGQSTTFNIFYGSRATLADAYSGLAQLGVTIDSFGTPAAGSLYSLGQSTIFGDGGGDDECEIDCEILTSSIPDMANDNSATFIFAFGGVGGVETGTTPEFPILPFVPAPGMFEFDAPIPGRWFDPPFATAFDYTLFGGATFTEVSTPPPGFGYGVLKFESSLGDFLMTPGVLYDLVGLGFGGLTTFKISGIAVGLLDSKDPAFTTLFPTFLNWTGTATKLEMVATLTDPAIPEPSTYLMLGAGVMVLAWMRKRQG